MPGYPNGKPAGEPCKHLDTEHRCTIYDARPQVCRDFRAEPQFCGSSQQEALKIFQELEL